MASNFPSNFSAINQLLGSLASSGANGHIPGINQDTLSAFLGSRSPTADMLGNLQGTANDPLTQFQMNFQALNGNRSNIASAAGLPNSAFQRPTPSREEILRRTFDPDSRNVIHQTGYLTPEGELTPTTLRKIIGSQLFRDRVAQMSDQQLGELAQAAIQNKTFSQMGILNELFGQVMEGLKDSPEYASIKDFAKGRTSTDLLKLAINEDLSPKAKVLLVMAANRQKSKRTMWNMIYAEVRKNMGQEDPYISKLQKDNDDLAQRISKGGEDEGTA